MTESEEEDVRYYVELSNRGIEDVGADMMFVAPGGTLVFRDAEDELVIAYAAGTWRTVTRG